jgi:site-specific recombinase XerD
MDDWGWEQLRPWLAVRAGVRRRFAPHQLRHAHAPELAREGCRSTSSSASWGI